MNRRAFMGRLGKPAAMVAALPVVAAAADRTHEAAMTAIRSLQDRFAGVQEQCTSLKDRMDRMEVRQKKLTRVALAGAAVLLGVDISLLL